MRLRYQDEESCILSLIPAPFSNANSGPFQFVPPKGLSIPIPIPRKKERMENDDFLKKSLFLFFCGRPPQFHFHSFEKEFGATFSLDRRPKCGEEKLGQGRSERKKVALERSSPAKCSFYDDGDWRG